MSKEPVAIGAAIIAAVNALVVLAVAFGAEIDSGQAAAINAAIVAIVGAVGAVVRSKVTPV